MKRLFFATLFVIAVAACGGDGGGAQPSGGGASSAPERETGMAEPGMEGSLWTRQFGTRHDEDAAGLAVDASGNVFVTGSTSGQLPGQTSFGFSDAWVRKYDDSGNEVWTRQFGSSEEGADSGEGAAVDSQGNLLLVGRTAKALSGTSAGGFDALCSEIQFRRERALHRTVRDRGPGPGPESRRRRRGQRLRARRDPRRVRGADQRRERGRLPGEVRLIRGTGLADTVDMRAVNSRSVGICLRGARAEKLSHTAPFYSTS